MSADKKMFEQQETKNCKYCKRWNGYRYGEAGFGDPAICENYFTYVWQNCINRALKRIQKVIFEMK